MKVNAGLVAVFALLAFVVVVPLAAIGVAWHLHDATPHDTKWNDLYSQPTFPLDDDPLTRPMAFDTVAVDR
jgi:cytochrome oxidase Cu insertion factor (SCO1/SenC/PrrC family)